MKKTKGEEILMGILWVSLVMSIIFIIAVLVIFSIKMYNDEDVSLSVIEKPYSEEIFNVNENKNMRYNNET